MKVRLKMVKTGLLLLLLVVLCAVLALLGERRGTRMAGETKSVSIGDFLEEAGLKEEVHELAKILQFDPSTRIRELPIASLPESLENGHKLETMTTDGRFFRVDTDRRELVKYGVLRPTVPVQKDVRLSKEDFLRKVESLVQLLRQPEVSLEQEARIRPDRVLYIPAEGEDGESSASGIWQVYVPRIYKGYETDSAILIRAFADSGEVETIANVPFTPPVSFEQRISEEQAKEIVEKRIEPGRHGLAIEKIERFICHPNSMTTLSEFGPVSYSEETKVCWKVTLWHGMERGSYDVDFYVDAFDGEILGSTQ